MSVLLRRSDKEARWHTSAVPPSTFSGNSASYGVDLGSSSKSVLVLSSSNTTAEPSGSVFQRRLLVAVLVQRVAQLR